jgi:hypothetical protein
MKKMVSSGMYWARPQFLDAVHQAIAASASALQKEAKELASSRLDPIPTPLPSMYQGFSLSRFKASRGAAESAAVASGLRGSYDRIKRVASTQPHFSSRFSVRELVQWDQSVENRVRFWYNLCGINYPSTPVLPSFLSSASSGGSNQQQSSSSSLDDDFAGLFSSTSVFSGLTSVAAPSSQANIAAAYSSASTSNRKKKAFSDKPGVHDVGKEALLAAPLILSDVIERVSASAQDWNIAIFLQHHDPDVAVAAAHALQSAIVSGAAGRGEIVHQLVSNILAHMTMGCPLYAPMATAEDNAVLNLLSHLLVLIDLWILSPSHSDDSTDYDFATLFDEVEALAVFCFCDSSPTVRLTALSILSAVQALRDRHDLSNQNKGFLWLIQQHNSDIVQRARLSLMLHLVGGLEDKVNLPPQLLDKDALRVEHCAVSRQELLWSFVLAETMASWVDNQLSLGPGASQVLRMVRHVAVVKVEVWKTLAYSDGSALPSINPWSSTAPSALNLRNCSLPLPQFALNGTSLVGSLSVDASSGASNILSVAQAMCSGMDVAQRCMANLPLIHRHVHVLLLASMACIPADLDRKSTPSAGTQPTEALSLTEYEQYVYDLCQTEQVALHKYLSNYLNSLLAVFQQSDTDRCLIDSTIIALSRIHWRAMKIVLTSAWKLLCSVSPKKTSRKRQKLRPDLTNLIRRISSSISFTSAIQLDSVDSSSGQLSRAILNFVDDACGAAPAALGKTPTLQIADYIFSLAVLVQRLLTGLEQLGRQGPVILCPHQGPLRQFLNINQNRSVLNSLTSGESTDGVVSVDWRSLAELLQSCLGFGKPAEFRRNMDETEVRSHHSQLTVDTVLKIVFLSAHEGIKQDQGRSAPQNGANAP